MDDVVKDPNKSVDNRKPDGTFGPGNNANPHGRPKGKTLKEFAREYLSSLPDEKKTEYLDQLPKDIVWKMAEGNPANATDVTSNGESLTPLLVKFLDDSKPNGDTQ